MEKSIHRIFKKSIAAHEKTDLCSFHFCIFSFLRITNAATTGKPAGEAPQWLEPDACWKKFAVRRSSFEYRSSAFKKTPGSDKQWRRQAYAAIDRCPEHHCAQHRENTQGLVR